jgi:hypothetical protein
MLLLSGCAAKKLEHFKFYAVSDGHTPGATPVQLMGQFDESQLRPAKAVDLTHFGIAVDKNGEGIENPDHHLSWYDLAPSEEPLRKVWLRHQFKSREFIIGSPKALLMPAHKIEAKRQKPEGLSYFCCYEILKPRVSLNRPVTLKDQLDTEAVKTTLKEPDLFCVPVLKRYNEKEEKIEKMKGPYNHLLIYRLDPRQEYKGVTKTVTDQFHPNNVLREFRSAYLAVPAHKTNWEPYTKPPPPPQK